jgi:tetratricopeptide (TPR) repeat protein
MKSAFRIAFHAACLLGGTLAIAQPSLAKKKEVPAPVQPTGHGSSLAKEERDAIAPLQAAVAVRDWGAASSALSAAQAGARSSDARYVVARLQLEMALATQNVAMQSAAIDAMAASGVTNAAELAPLLQSQGALASSAGKRDRAEALYARVIELQPNNADALLSLARIKSDLRKPVEAAALIDRAIAVREAAGQRPPESWYQYGLRLAVDNKLAALGGRLGRGLAGAYPSAENWRDAMLAYQDLHPGDPDAIDGWRLMRASKALAGERDFMAFAQAAGSAGLAAEARAVLDEGVSRRMVDPAKASFKELIATSGRKAAADRAGLSGRESAAMAAATGTAALSAGDLLFGYGDYGKAAALYAAARQKGGVDDGVAATRLGAALALAGQRTEAEAAFRAVTGANSDLAGLWLIWLRQAA